MNILLIGLGSIGQRHLRNILLSGYDSVSVVSRSGILPPKFTHLAVFTSVNDALAGNNSFEAAIICTPTAFHTSALKVLLKAKIPNIYIEKPVSHSLAGLAELVELSAEYKNNIAVGYDLRFDPGLQKVKQLLEEDVIGKVVSVNAVVGQYLPDWRPHEDYSKGMSAKRETGGGVMLDLVHEFDYLLWLFGKVETIACQYSNSGALNIETEDVSNVLLRFQNGASGTIHLDYLQPWLVRNCMITGYNGTIFWNLADSNVTWITIDKKDETFSYSGYERNNRFIEIMQTFLQSKNDNRLTSLAEGIESLTLVVAAKHSGDNGVFVHLKDFSPMPVTQ